jgi:hypothetical protein
MTHIHARSIRQTAGILVSLGLTLLLAGAGCSDNGGATGPDNGNGDGNEIGDVSFSEHVLPILQANCAGSGCHIGTASPAQGLDLSTYSGVIAGANSGAVVIANDADGSELIMRMEGNSQPSMPFGEDLLPQETVDTVRAWINQGAENN